MVTDASLGTLYINPIKSGVAQWRQPGGPGTIVYPSQPAGEQAALFVLSCGHFQNNFAVYFDTYQPETGPAVPAALFCCSLCSFLQRIVVPATAIYDENVPILFP